METARVWNRNALFFVFALSGFSGLIYESIWSHYLKLFLGHAAYSQTLVLTIFMGGMAVGAWIASRYCRRINHLFWYYAIVELIIGLGAFIFHPLFAIVRTVSYHTIMPILGSASLVEIYKWTIAGLLILPQSVLLGSTFPLMSNAVIRRFPRIPGFSLSMLYFTNSIGAGLGVLASGFWLINAVGLPGTLMVAGSLNVVVAILTWVLTYLFGFDEDTQRAYTPKEGETFSSSGTYRFILIGAGITGAASFMYEIGWIRMLSFVLGSSTHAFELMLSAFILGLALGGLWIRRHIDHLKNPIYFLAMVQIIMGFLALCTLVFYDQTFHLMGYILSALARTDAGYTLFNVTSHLIAMAMMIPVTFCAGMTLPLMTQILVTQRFGEKSIGAVYASNTVGSIIGVVLAVQFVMPVFSVKSVIIGGALLDVSLAIALLLWVKGFKLFPALSYNPLTTNGKIAATTAGCVTLLMLTWSAIFLQLNPGNMASGVYRNGQVGLPPGAKVIYQKDGKTATVTVTEINENVKVIATNGKPDASIAHTKSKQVTLDEPTQVLMAALPLSVYDGARNAAVIGFGSGVTSHILLDLPTMQQVDTVEIEPAMSIGARYFFPRNSNVYQSSRSKIYFDDAKAFFSTHQGKYDLIVSEPSNPWVGGVSGLFSYEFYDLMKGHLSQEGIFTQWMHTYEINMELIISVLKSIDQVFPYYSIYSTSDTDILIMAKVYSPVGLPTSAIFSVPKIKEELSRIGVDGLNDLDLRRIGTQDFLRPYIQAFKVPANSDYYPYLDLHAVKARFLGQRVVNFNNVGFITPISMLEPNEPRYDTTVIGNNTAYSRAKIAQEAVLLYNAITRKEAYNKQGISPRLQSIVDTLTYRNGQCVTEENNKLWNDSFFLASTVMTNYLSERELDQIWGVISAQACAESMPAFSRQLFALFKVVGARNASGMSRIGESLLRDYPDADHNMRVYFLSVAIIGRVAHEQYREALTDWDHFGRSMFKGGVPVGALQVLIAYAIDHYKQQ